MFDSTENLKQLIESAKENGITFYYALSPGLDIAFSSSRDIQFLKKKMNQVQYSSCYCIDYLITLEGFELYRKIHCLTSEFHVKFHARTDIARVTKR